MATTPDDHHGFSVPSLLETTESTVYRWATDSPQSVFRAGELSRVSEEDVTVGKQHQLNHITHLAKLLDQFNMENPPAESTRSSYAGSRSLTPLSDSVAYNGPSRTVTHSLDMLPNGLHEQTTSHSAYDSLRAHNNIGNQPQNHNSAVDEQSGQTRGHPFASSAVNTGVEAEISKDDYLFLLRQFREMARECEKRDAIISQLQAQSAESNRSQSLYSGPRDNKLGQGAAQSSLNSQTQRHVIIEDRGTSTPSPANNDGTDYVSFSGLGDPEQVSKNSSESYGDEPTTIRRPVPISPAQPDIKEQPATNHAMTLSSTESPRTLQEMRLLESLNDALRNSLRLEQDLQEARREVAELREMFNSMIRKQDTPVSIDVSPVKNSTPNGDRLPSAIDIQAPTLLQDSPAAANSTRASTNPLRSYRSKSYENANSGEIIEELEKLLGEAEREVAKLKGNAIVMGPNLMPDMKSYATSKSAKLYYRLEMNEVDQLGVSELGNLIKNILLQLSTPFSKLPERIMSLSTHLQNEDSYMHFANDIHMALYGGAQMDPGPPGSTEELYCLGEMIGWVQKLVRAAERRKQNKAMKKP